MPAIWPVCGPFVDYSPALTPVSAPYWLVDDGGKSLEALFMLAFDGLLPWDKSVKMKQ